jgi:hypothetical protein
MTIIKSTLIACAIAGAFAFGSSGSASALSLGAIGASTADVTSIELFHQIQGRRPGVGRPGRVRPGGARPGRAVRPSRGGRSPGGNARRNRNNALGAAAAIGVGAALLGAIAGSAS